MKKILSSVLLASFFSFSSFAEVTNPQPQPTAIDEILKLLNLWSDLYPQCFQDVADIKQAISELQNLNGVVISEISAFHGDFANLHSELGPRLVAYENYLQQISDGLSSHSSALQTLTSTVISEISAFHGDFANLHSELGYHLPSFDNYLNQILQLISEHFSKLPDFSNWSPNVKVSNYIDLKDVLRDLFGEIIVNCHLDADPSFNVNVNFDFNYDYFLPIKQLNEKANRSYFSLNPYTRFIPYTWVYKSGDHMDYLINPMQSSAPGVDLLDFLCSCGNALVSQNEDISALLCQILGFFKSGNNGDGEQLKTMATTAADGAQQDLDSLKSAFHASSLEDVASQYFVDLSIDEKFDTDFLGFGGGAGNHCPDFIDIGPIPFSKIHDSMSDYTLHFSTAGLLSFFDICRQCFTVVWYLFFLTICIFLARFGWAFLKPIFRSLTSVLDW